MIPARNPPPGPRFSGNRTIRTADSSAGSSSPPAPFTTTTIFEGASPSVWINDRTTWPASPGRRWVRTTAVTFAGARTTELAMFMSGSGNAST